MCIRDSYEADDDYWDFSGPGLHNDTFELVVDGDLSGGPLIERFSPARDLLGKWETYFSMQGAHAQNYHIFTPAAGKDWCMVWGPEQWIKELPYANAAQKYDFKPGQPGHYVLEFWITPFDFAGADGPPRAVESILKENIIIGLSWAVIDYDDVNSGTTNNGFWNLSRHHTMYGLSLIHIFTGGKGFGGKAAVHGRFNAQNKFAAEIFFSQRVGHGVAVRVNQFHHFLDGLTEFRIHARLVAAVNSARHDFRAAANEALILVAPLHKFRVARSLFFDLLACHTQFSLLVAQFYFAASKAWRTSRS